MEQQVFSEGEFHRIILHAVDEDWIQKYSKPSRRAFDSTKRLLDIITASVLLIMLLPVSFIIAMLHLLESSGSLFFIQQRVGYRGAEFKLFKFRTMVMDAEKDGPKFAITNDCRVTRVGRFMRMFRIDEVPQLFNVIRGDMSLVGPRPERQEFIEMLTGKILMYRMRFEIKPGLTGWAQVKNPYAGDDVNHHRRKLEYDLFYLKNRNMFLDAKILLKTVGIVLSKKGI
jgi:lipopolysaccharide/colanic/teichoic acid biosynthesis glycosyltransferase